MKKGQIHACVNKHKITLVAFISEISAKTSSFQHHVDNIHFLDQIHISHKKNIILLTIPVKAQRQIDLETAYFVRFKRCLCFHSSV